MHVQALPALDATPHDWYTAEQRAAARELGATEVIRPSRDDGAVFVYSRIGRRTMRTLLARDGRTIDAAFL